MKKILGFFVVSAAFLVFLVDSSYANNVAVSNVTLENVNLGNASVDIKFTLTQNNTYSGTDANGASFYDRLWIFVKYTAGTPSENTGWSHATLASGGTVTPASDGKGGICQVGANQTVKWSYGADGVSGVSTVRVKVCAIEVAYIPQGQFIYNGGGIGGSTYNNYGGGSQATITSAANVPTGASTGWPNGYSAFYIAKYEVSHGQYADFLNMLPQSTATTRFSGQSAYEHTITYASGNSYGSRYASSTPNRACNYLSWDDVLAYASWCGMRPMTEMEFEKAARGGGTTAYTYPWGNTDPSTGNSVYTPSSNTSPYDAWKYYANFYDSSNNVTGQDGPTDVGLYLSGDMGRTDEQTGASPYGVTDLAGSLWEHLINCAQTITPANGNGTVTPPASWPGAASGKGLRGGSWNYESTYLRVSDRYFAGWTDTDRFNTVGFRPARTP